MPQLTIDPREIDFAEAERLLCARSLSHFVRRAWPSVIPDKLIWNWHMDAICEHLEAVARGEINRLLINVPPGSSKSTLVGVMLPSWLWGPMGQPWQKIIGAAHEQGLAIRDNRMMRELVRSEWYQSLWPVQLTGDQNEKRYFENSARGFRQACAVASMTGRRGGLVLWDDPVSPEKAHSEADRQTALRVFSETLPTRLVDPIKSAIIVVMQRLHEEDPSGYILANDLGYEHLCIPMEFEPSRKCVTSIGWEDPRKTEGELMFPARFPQHVIDRDKKALGEYAWAGQMQQRPAPAGGGIFKREWWGRFDLDSYNDAEAIRLVWSWDTAFEATNTADYSVGLLLAEHADGYNVLAIHRSRLEFPQLKRKVQQLWDAWPADVLLIEKKASGAPLVQDLRNTTKLPIQPIVPKGDKTLRANIVTPILEQGKVRLPYEAPWLETFLSETSVFPNGTHDDQVDALTQALIWLQRHSRQSSFTYKKR